MANIILEGFMGCGKSTIGKAFADKYDKTFVDTDSYIEDKYNRVIADIFANEGEEYFRDLETEAVKELAQKDNLVIALGGGLPLRKINQDILKSSGKVYYLKASIDTLCNRLKGDTKRPLLAGCDLESRIKELMKKRAHIYEAFADYFIETDEKNIEEIIFTMKEISNEM